MKNPQMIILLKKRYLNEYLKTGEILEHIYFLLRLFRQRNIKREYLSLNKMPNISATWALSKLKK